MPVEKKEKRSESLIVIPCQTCRNQVACWRSLPHSVFLMVTWRQTEVTNIHHLLYAGQPALDINCNVICINLTTGLPSNWHLQLMTRNRSKPLWPDKRHLWRAHSQYHTYWWKNGCFSHKTRKCMTMSIHDTSTLHCSEGSRQCN